ncbi:MAG: VWA domain-containing protein [Acidimicrobiia bacterium]|nr:VWA domain-containing protein [Acidimicrobiia bacterium]
MISLLTDFVQELRTAGLPVSMVEAIDAMEAITHIDLADRSALKAALGATMVKNSRHEEAFSTVFDVFFSVVSRPVEEGEQGEERPTWTGEGSTAGEEMGTDQLIEAMFEALSAEDFEELRRLAKEAVDRLAGIEPGRPVGGTYYLYRTMRQLDVDSLRDRLLQAFLTEDEDAIDELERRLRTEEASALVERLREEIQAEIRRRLVEDRGRDAVAKTLRQPLVEDLDLMHATRTDLRNIEKVIEPLTRKLAARLAQRRRLARTGRLDFRKTMRASLAAGGVPIDPKFKVTRPHRPEIFLLCDISGSMATFARFTLQFTYAMSAQFSRLRSFVFVDAVDEVTDYLKPGSDFNDALGRISTEADVVWLDGHSDYGHAFEQFTAKYGRELTPRSTLIIAGDARNNYREPRAQFLGEMANTARAVYWLNPEPKAYWDSGDSVMARYATWCDEVFEVRNIRQLEEFVEKVAMQPLHPGRRRIPSIGHRAMPMNSANR